MGRGLSQQDRMLRAYTEAQVQATVTDLLTVRGWVWHHETDSRLSPRGMPDVVAAHPNGWWAYLEIKREIGKVTPEQQRWLETLVAGMSCDWQGSHLWMSDHHRKLVGVVRPSNLDLALDKLQLARSD